MNPIEKTSGPCIILAGAGTGKTYIIVEKLNYLIKNNIYPAEKVVCITFSNEAANNLILRADKMLENKKEIPIIRTFHGFSADLLRKYGDRIQISKEFKILDPEQAMIMLHRSLKVSVLNCRKYITTINSSKDLGISIKEFEEYIKEVLIKYKDIDLEKRLESLNFEIHTLYLRKNWIDKRKLTAEIKKIRKILDIKQFVSTWRAYEKLKQKGNYQDYSDLNKNALYLLEKCPEICEDFSYVIVDEFQDTNKLQLDFLIKLATNKNITVVGDMNQSIYRFRGAYKDNLQQFKKAFSVSEEEIFNLAKSYRSPNSVLKAAHDLILHNYSNKDDCFLVENISGKEGEKIQVIEVKDAKEEARKVVEIIQKELNSGKSLEDICVMYRAHYYSTIIKKALEQAGIPYYAAARTSLLKQKSVKTAIDYLTILKKLKRKEKGGEQEWWDLVYQLNFQQEDLIKIGTAIKEFFKKDKSDSEKENRILSVYLFNNLENIDFSDEGKIAAKSIIQKLKMIIPYTEDPISKLLEKIYFIAGLTNEQKTSNEKEVMMNLSKLQEISKTHEELYDSNLANFLYYIDVIKSLDIDIEAAQLEEKGVRLMSSHSTKGLEYETVILTNFADGRFPIERYSENALIPIELLPEIGAEIKYLNEGDKEEFISKYQKQNQLLEERRLAYVSFTRTKEKLFITFAEEYGGKKTLPSKFLNEINFRNNPNINFLKDIEQKYAETINEEKGTPSFTQILTAYDFDDLLKKITENDKKDQEKEHKKFSPSALLLFSKCKKEFEYRYIFNMPERKTPSWEAMRLGSFVHIILEKGVKANFRTVEEFIQLSKEMHMGEEWESVSITEAETLIRVFFERNKDSYNENSKTEQYLPLQLAGLDFIGFADRIDFLEDGVQIIDYKTGKNFISPKNRDWQLGFYALAAEKKHGRVRKVILDMLKQDKPLEFVIDEKGNAICTVSSRIDGFNIYKVEEELIKTAREIQESYRKGFKPCPIENNCDFCNEYVYGI